MVGGVHTWVLEGNWKLGDDRVDDHGPAVIVVPDGVTAQDAGQLVRRVADAAQQTCRCRWPTAWSPSATWSTGPDDALQSRGSPLPFPQPGVRGLRNQTVTSDHRILIGAWLHVGRRTAATAVS